MINNVLNNRIKDVKDFVNDCISKSADDVRLYSGLNELFTGDKYVNTNLTYQDLLDVASKYNNILLCINELLKRL